MNVFEQKKINEVGMGLRTILSATRNTQIVSRMVQRPIPTCFGRRGIKVAVNHNPPLRSWKHYEK